ncbi:MAG: hypothetical protein KIT68_04605 [Phycisphaeraceae bacterium]|nr:hypothetical protein [Phycisphaeraceae bacterium]
MMRSLWLNGAALGAAWCSAVAVAPARGATADEPPAAASLPTNDAAWRAEFTTWIWLVGMTGDVQARGVSGSVDANFGDVLEASDSLLAFSGRLEVGYGSIAGFIDGMYASIGAERQLGPGGLFDLEVKNEQGLIDFGLMYRLGTWEPSGDAAKGTRKTTLDVFGGGRYSVVALELDPGIGPTVSQSKGWVDPILGARLVLPVAEQWHLSLSGDVGGFGVSSDLTWSASAGVGFDFTMFGMPATLFAGYRAVGWDYSSGSGASAFRWDIIQHGPLLGLSVRF